MIRLLIILIIVTAYAPSAGGVNAWGDGSITALGYAPGPGIAACGSAWPDNALVIIPGYGAAICGDRGGGLAPTQVDVWMASEDEALAWGVQERVIVAIGRDR